MKTNLLIYICLLLLSFGVVSCDPVRRINRIAKKHGIEFTDTIRVKDTITIKKEIHDTTVITKPNDTITIENERLKVRVLRFHDTIKVNAECKEVVRYIDRKIPVKTYQVIEKTWWEKYKSVILIGFIILLLLIIASRIAKKLI